MRKKLVFFEISELEIRVFKASSPFWGNLHQSHLTTLVEFDRIPISGIIEQGVVHDEDALLRILLDYQLEHPCEGCLAYLAIPLQTGFVRSYKLPWLSRRNRKSAIALLVDQEVPSSADLLYDYVVLDEEKHKSVTILLGASRQGILDKYVSIFKRARIEVGGLNFAVAVLGQGLELNPSDDVLYLQEESDGLQVVLFRGMVPESIRTLHSINRSINQSSLLLPGNGGNNGSIKEHFEDWENEISRFLLYFRTQYEAFNLKRLVWSGSSTIESLAKSISAAHNVSEMEQARLKSVPDVWSRVLRENKGWGEVAIAYGTLILSKSSVLNLWRHPIRAYHLQQRYQRLVFGLFILFLLGNFSWLFLHRRTLTMQQEVQQLSRQGSRIEAQVKQQKNLERAWKIAQAQSEKIGNGLGQVQTLAGSRLKFEKLVYKQGNMSITGSAEDAKSIQSLMHGLRTLGWSQPFLTGYRSTSLEKIEFSLSTKREHLNSELLTP